MTTDTISKQRRMVERLADMTKREKIEWVEGDYPEGIKVSFGNYNVNIFEASSSFGENDYVIVISDEWRGDIDRFSDTELSSGSTAPSGETYYQVIDRMYKDARRQIKGVDKALDNILSDLDDIMPF